MKIEATHEDKIYPIREFICRLGRVCDEQFERLHAELVADGFPADGVSKDWLFDYCFNSDVDEEVVSLEEYMDSEYMIDYRKLRDEKMPKAVSVRNNVML